MPVLWLIQQVSLLERRVASARVLIVACPACSRLFYTLPYLLSVHSEYPNRLQSMSTHLPSHTQTRERICPSTSPNSWPAYRGRAAN